MRERYTPSTVGRLEDHRDIVAKPLSQDQIAMQESIPIPASEVREVIGVARGYRHSAVVASSLTRYFSKIQDYQDMRVWAVKSGIRVINSALPKVTNKEDAEQLEAMVQKLNAHLE